MWPGVHQSDATSEPACLGIEPHPVWRGWSGSVLLLLPEVAAAECEPSISPARGCTWPTLSQGGNGISLQQLCLLTAAKPSLMPSQRLKVKCSQSCLTLCDPMDYTVHGILQAGILERVDVSLTQGLNPGLPHCRQILYQLSHQGSPRIPAWVAYPFSSGSSWPMNWTGASCIAVRFLQA